MSKPFPDDPFLKGNFAPLTMECDAHDLPVRGEIPPGLAGRLFRNGPNPQFAPRDRYHWFAGDGMVHGFHFADGKVSYRNRWVRTPKFELEREAGRSLFGSFNNPLTSDPSVLGKDSSLANTNIVCHGGRLLALEEGHLPVEMDPETLATKGNLDFGGKLRGPVTAHPKIDPQTGELVFFAYNAKGRFTPWIAYYTADASGRVTRSELFETPFASMVHDFVATDRHVLFPILPLTGSLERAVNRKPAFAWEPELGSHIAIMPRNGTPADIRWFRAEGCYVFHPMNAWEADGKIYADVMKYEAAPLFPHADGTPGDPKKAIARLARWTFDLDGNSDQFKQEYIDDLPGEFPRFDERRAGLAYEHGYFACYHRDGSPDRGVGGFNAIADFNARTGERRIYALPSSDAVSEPVFVPRHASASEADGWLLSVIYRGTENRSDLIVLDTDDISKGPVAIIELAHRVPFGFHGNWLPA